MPQLLADPLPVLLPDQPSPPQVQSVLDLLLELIARQAAKERISARTLSVIPVSSSDEMPLRLVVTQEVDLTTQEALTYWDRLSDTIEQWAASLPEAEAQIALDFLIVDVRWKLDETDI